MTMGSRIRTRRHTLGLSQTELAARVGVSRPTISELENGTRTTMTTDTAKALARALGVSIDHLVGTWDDQSADADQAQRLGMRSGRGCTRLATLRRTR